MRSCFESTRGDLRSLILLCLLGASFGPSACGGDGGGEVTRQTVADHFKERTGEPLALSVSKKGLPYESLGLSSLDNRRGELTERGLRLTRKFGAFTVWVVKPGRNPDRAIAKLLAPNNHNDKAFKQVETVASGPDSEGVVWTRSCQTFKPDLGKSCSYRAAKRYGERVLVTWEGGETKGTDARWARLDGVLTELPGE